MESRKRDGLKLTERDGSPLRWGAFCHWDAELAEMVGRDLHAYCPLVEFTRATPEAERFSAVFRRDWRNGREMCWDSVSIADGAKVTEEDARGFVAALDRFHARAEQADTTGESKRFIRDFRVPHPRDNPEAWRVARVAGRRHLVVLWGYAKTPSERDVAKPLTETSKAWTDRSERVDLYEELRVVGALTRNRFDWRWLFLTLFKILLLLGLLAALAYSLYRFFPWSVGSTPPKMQVTPPESKPPVASSPESESESPVASSPESESESPVVPSPESGSESPVVPSPESESESPVVPSPESESESPVAPSPESEPPPQHCDVHPKAVVPRGGRCPVRCGRCGRHLDGDGQCSEMCENVDRHRNGKPCHLDADGRCPECRQRPDVVPLEASIHKISEDRRKDLHYPVFELTFLSGQVRSARVQWFVDQRQVGGLAGVKYAVREGFAPDSQHRIDAQASFYDEEKGADVTVNATPFFWTGPGAQVADSNIERHINIVARRRDGLRDYYVFRVFSNPDTGDLKVKRWSLVKDGRKIPFDQEPGHPGWIRLYTDQVPGEGKIKVAADIRTSAGRRTVRGSFRYTNGILSESSSFNPRTPEEVKKWEGVKSQVAPSVYCVLTRSSSGTAFAVSERLLVTNCHVVDNVPRGGRVRLIQGQTAVDAVVLQKRYDESVFMDLAVLEVTSGRLRPLKFAENCSSGMKVCAVGYPYTAFENNKSAGEGLKLESTYGTVEEVDRVVVVHDAGVYPGNSGGPLLDGKGQVVGVNTVMISRQERGERVAEHGGSIPAGVVLDFLRRCGR